jgi:hypothetical protein
MGKAEADTGTTFSYRKTVDLVKTAKILDSNMFSLNDWLTILNQERRINSEEIDNFYNMFMGADDIFETGAAAEIHWPTTIENQPGPAKIVCENPSWDVFRTAIYDMVRESPGF